MIKSFAQMNHRECLGDFKICEILRQLFFNSYFLKTECKIWKSKYTPKSFFFFSVRDKCHPNPCHHDGRCETEGLDFACSCSRGWSGETCEGE